MDRRNFLLAILSTVGICIPGESGGKSMTTQIEKSPIGEQDLNRWAGLTSKTFTRDTSTGYEITLNKIGHEVDALISYGGGVNYTRATIAAALTAIGTTNRVRLVMRPGTWVIDQTTDWSDYTNVEFYFPPGAVLSGAYAITFPAGTKIPSAAFSSLSAAVTLLGSSACTLEVNKSETITGNTTLASTTAIRIAKGTTLTVSTGVTLTINGPFEAGLYQVFSLSGTGKVEFAQNSSAKKLYPQWWGAKGDESNDDRPALQAAINACLSSQIPVYVPAGVYLIKTVGATDLMGDVCGLYSINQLTGADQYKRLTLRGDGLGSTKITASSGLAINALASFQYNGNGITIDSIQFVLPGYGYSAGIKALSLRGNAIRVNNCYTGGGKYGIYLLSGEATIDNHVDEYSGTSIWLQDAINTTVRGAKCGSSTDQVMKIAATVSGSGVAANTAKSGITISDSALGPTVAEQVAVTIDVEEATHSHIVFNNCHIGNGGFSAGGGTDPYAGYGVNVVKAAHVSFNNTIFQLLKFGNLLQGGTFSFTNCTFDRSGYRASTNWVTRDLWIVGSNTTIVNCKFISGAGTAIYADGPVQLSIIGNEFSNNVTGGLDASNVETLLPSSTVGNYVIQIVAGNTAYPIKIIGNDFYAPAGHASDGDGKYGVKIDGATAVPGAGKVIITGNTVSPTSYAGNFVLSGITTAQKNAWYIVDDDLSINTPIGVPSYANSEAPNSTLYYSTDASKLVWKDSGGSVNNLY